MNIIVKLKKLFMKKAGIFEVWDTSAISTWFDEFVKSAITQGIKVIVPEGVLHELSAGRHSYEKCRDAYNFINRTKNENVIVYVTKDVMRSWPIDEQIVAIAYEYHKKGYDVRLVTCDRDQANKAYYRGVSYRLLKGNREYPIAKKENLQQSNSQPKVENKPYKTAPVRKALSIPCVTKNSVKYISVKYGIAVYDAKGKRKIGRDNLIAVSNTDVFTYKEHNYKIESVTDTSIFLRRIDSA